MCRTGKEDQVLVYMALEYSRPKVVGILGMFGKNIG